MTVLQAFLLATATVVAVLLIVVGLGRRGFRARVSAEIGSLFATAGAGVSLAELAARRAALPEPVRRHLEFAILDGAPPSIRGARLKHAGTFRTSPRHQWFPIRGEQYFTVGEPGFVWNAAIRTQPGLWVEARDCLLGDHGGMLVKVCSTWTLADARGPDMDQGAAARWLAESVWFPYAWWSDRIAWEPIDEHSARATLRYGGPPVALVFTLDDEGRFAGMRGERSHGAEGRVRGWKARCRDYREFAGVRVPSQVEVAWELEGEDFSYARFQVTRLEYNAAERY